MKVQQSASKIHASNHLSMSFLRMYSHNQDAFPRTGPDYIGQHSLPFSYCSFSFRSMSLYNKLYGHPTEGWMKEEAIELLTKIYRDLNELVYKHLPNLVIFFPLFILQPHLPPSFTSSNIPFLKIFTGTGKVTENPPKSLTSPLPQRDQLLHSAEI